MAVVQPLRAPGTFYARSRQNGLYKSVDGGKSWSAANGNLNSRESLTMRSVAVHPENPDIVLRGGGHVQGGKLVSGLWKSVDGGRSWRQVASNINFDGSGPTSFFGEVISFNPQDPERVSAAGESSGVFTSLDGGDTWKHAGLRGLRVSCLQYSPYEDGPLQVGSVANSEFAALGLGRPAIDLPGQTEGTLWTSRRPRHSLQLRVTARHFGITDMAFDVEKWGFLHVAGTRGLYNSYSLQNLYLRRATRVPCGRLYTSVSGSLRLFRAVKYGRGSSKVYAAPFSGPAKNPVFVTDSWGNTWTPCDGRAESTVTLNSGISGVCADVSNKDRILLCNREGIYLSEDAGRSFRLVLPSSAAR